MDQQLTVEQVAERLQVNEQTVRRWLRDGDLKGSEFGGRTGWRVSLTALVNFMRARDNRIPMIRNVLEARGIAQDRASLIDYIASQGWELKMLSSGPPWSAEVKVTHAPGQVTWSTAADHVTDEDAIADAVAMAILDVEGRR